MKKYMKNMIKRQSKNKAISRRSIYYVNQKPKISRK